MTCSECGAYRDLTNHKGKLPLTCGDACAKARSARRARERYKQDESYRATKCAPHGSCSKCEKPIHIRTTSRVNPICRDCQRANPGYKATPPPAFPKAPKSCADCGVDCIRKPSRYDGKRRCVECSRVRDLERNAAKCRVRRAVRKNLPTERYTLAEVQELSCHVCGICGGVVDPTLSGLDEYGPTVDHIIPIAKGGPDLRHNVQLAHRVCNLRKGARI